MDNINLEIPEILIDQKTLQRRINEMGKKITEVYKNKHLIVISVSNGATIFVADLIRKIDLPMQLDSISASSYEGTESRGKVDIFSRLKLDIKGHNILLVDDILDTGRTMMKIVEFLHSMNPESVETCVLLDKPARRVVKVEADYYGFEVPDVFVVGYGLDHNEYYRNLSYVGQLK